MKKFLFVLVSVLMMASVSAQENHIESADTGVLVELVGQLIPIGKIDVINSTCVVGMSNIEEAGGVPVLMYSYWIGDYGIYQSTLGMKFQETEAVTLMMMFDEGTDEGVRALKDWIKFYAPKDDKLIEEQARKFMKQYNKNDKEYVLFRAEDRKVELGRSIVIIYSTKELARQRGFEVE